MVKRRKKEGTVKKKKKNDEDGKRDVRKERKVKRREEYIGCMSINFMHIIYLIYFFILQFICIFIFSFFNFLSIFSQYIILDEGHRIKNRNCRLVRELKQFRSVSRLLLTGTPIQVCTYGQWLLYDFLLISS